MGDRSRQFTAHRGSIQAGIDADEHHDRLAQSAHHECLRFFLSHADIPSTPTKTANGKAQR
jgi:hypothetical protein